MRYLFLNMNLLTFPEGHIESQAPSLVPKLGTHNLRIAILERVFIFSTLKDEGWSK